MPSATCRSSGKSDLNTCAVEFAPGLSSEDEAADRVRLNAQIGCATLCTLELTTHAPDLQVGRVVRIDAGEFGARTSGDYLVIRLDHELRQYAGLGLGGESDTPYSCTATLVARETPYFVAKTALPQLPLTFQARIESTETTADLDANGRTRYRQYNDSHSKKHGQNSIYTRRLQPLGGPGHKGHQPGWHQPLHDGAEILLSCLNSDPDRADDRRHPAQPGDPLPGHRA